MTPAQRLRYPRQLVEILARQGVKVFIKDGALRATPREQLDAETLEVLREWKAELLQTVPLMASPLWNLPADALFVPIGRAKYSTPPDWVGKEKPAAPREGPPAVCRMCDGAEFIARPWEARDRSGNKTAAGAEYICLTCHPTATPAAPTKTREDKAA